MEKSLVKKRAVTPEIVPNVDVNTKIGIANLHVGKKILKNQDRHDGKLDNIIDAQNKVIENMKAQIPSLPVDEAVDNFTEHISGKKRSTRESYGSLVKIFSNHFCGRDMAQITKKDLEAFLGRYYGDNSASSVKLRVTQLGTMYEESIRYLIGEQKPAMVNICRLVQIDNTTKPRDESVSPLQISRLLRSLNDDAVELIVLMMATGGFRISEAIKLDTKHVDGRIITLENTKNGLTYERVVPAWVTDKLAQFLLMSKDDLPFLGKSNPTDVWMAMENRRKGVLKYIQRRFPNIKAHSMRKFCITFWEHLELSRMAEYVRRHESDKLRNAYVSYIPHEEAMALQDEHMGPGIFQ